MKHICNYLHIQQIVLNKKEMSDIGRTLNHFEHVLLRPDTYVGSIRTCKKEVWTYGVNAVSEFKKKEIQFNSALFSIIREIGSNVIDNKWRGEEKGINMSKVDVSFDAKTCEITFRNDGRTIPVELNEYEKEDYTSGNSYVHKAYPAEVFFGEMMSSTNYDDTEKRKTSGKNGVGASCTNIFSKKFTVEHTDGKKKFIQKYENNAKDRTKPCVTQARCKGYTQISFIPDYERFGYQEIINTPEGKLDFISVLKYYAAEMATMMKAVPVNFSILNYDIISESEDEVEEENVDSIGLSTESKKTCKIIIKDLMKYAKMHFPNSKNLIQSELNGDECVLIEISDPEDVYESSDILHRSYVNGILTFRGGEHLKKWRDSIIPQVVKELNSRKFKKGETRPKASARSIYPYFLMFVRCEIDKPEFTSQTKEELGLPPPGAKQITAGKLKKEQLSKMMKWDFVELLDNKLLEHAERKATNKERVQKVSMGKKYRSAGWAGKKRTKEMLPDEPKLFITEGMSAKGFALRGIDAVPNGQNKYGAFAIRGKFINVQNSSKLMVSKNEEVIALKRVLGLVSGVDYTIDKNFNELRYRSVCFLTDADDDGIHIRGLLINFFWKLFPSLTKRGFFTIMNKSESIERGCLQAMATPVVRVTAKKNGGKGVEELFFYSNPEFKKWISDNNNKSRIVKTKTDDGVKYYKGLGAINPKEAPKYFAEQLLVNYILDGDETKKMALGFDSKETCARKKWIKNCLSNGVGEYVYEGNISISNFVNDQLVVYNITALRRSIPSMFDGFKESQRKILYGMRVKNYNSSLDIESIGGALKDITGYHHGAVSLYEAIFNMGRGFVGTNNIPLLINDGEFGTRLGGNGKDGDQAQPRYAKTKLDDIAYALFSKSDDDILAYRYEDNFRVEPETYAPILPMLLINGSEGIGSGWSTKWPNYNPEDICKYICNYLGEKQNRKKIVPWYRNFTGEIDLDKDKSGKVVGWTSRGILQECKEGWWKITDLPIGVWGYSAKDELEKLLNGNPRYLLDLEEMCSANKIHFRIKPTKNYIPDIDAKNNMGFMKKKHSLRNMYALDENDTPRKFDSPEEYLEMWIPWRLDLYKKRKEHIISKLESELVFVKNKFLYIKSVVEGNLNMNAENDVLENNMLEIGLEKLSHSKNSTSPSFEYLLGMQMRSMTKEKYETLEKEKTSIESHLESYKHKSVKDLFREDIDMFLKKYKLFLKERHE